MKLVDPQARIQAELDKAEEARARGNEGRARVCARRAAGIAAREYFARRGRVVRISEAIPRTPSAYDLLNLLAEDSSLSADLRQAAAHLTLRVDEEFKLPMEVDLIAEARKLCRELLSENKP